MITENDQYLLPIYDPSERPINMNVGQQKLLIQLSSCQPKLKSFPESGTVQRNKVRPFWFDSFSHFKFRNK